MPAGAVGLHASQAGGPADGTRAGLGTNQGWDWCLLASLLPQGPPGPGPSRSPRLGPRGPCSWKPPSSGTSRQLLCGLRSGPSSLCPRPGGGGCGTRPCSLACHCVPTTTLAEGAVAEERGDIQEGPQTPLWWAGVGARPLPRPGPAHPSCLRDVGPSRNWGLQDLCQRRAWPEGGHAAPTPVPALQVRLRHPRRLAEPDCAQTLAPAGAPGKGALPPAPCQAPSPDPQTRWPLLRPQPAGVRCQALPLQLEGPPCLPTSALPCQLGRGLVHSQGPQDPLCARDPETHWSSGSPGPHTARLGQNSVCDPA